MSNAPVNAPPSLEVTRHGGMAVVMVVGLGNMHLAPTLQAFVEDGIGKGFVRVALDLGRCDGLDSTFMGTMVGLSVTLKEQDGWLCVMHVGADNERLLRTLGVWEFISVIRPPRLDPSVQRVRLCPTADTGTRLQQIQQAHRHLVDIDEANRVRFGPFLAAVDKEMAELARLAPHDDILDLDDLEELPFDNEPPKTASQAIQLPIPPSRTPTPPPPPLRK